MPNKLCLPVGIFDVVISNGGNSVVLIVILLPVVTVVPAVPVVALLPVIPSVTSVVMSAVVVAAVVVVLDWVIGTDVLVIVVTSEPHWYMMLSLATSF